MQRISRRTPLCDSLLTTQVTVQRIDLSISHDTLISPGDSVLLRAVVPPGDTYHYRWEPPEGLSCPSCAQTWAKPTVATQYSLSVEKLTTGCQKVQSLVVLVGSCVVHAPTAFTPNNDGVNDVFFIPGNSCVLQIAELTIYNRWGEIIFRKENIPASEPAFGWDGTYQGIRVDNGVYAFRMQVNFINGLTHRYHGMVTLVR